MAACSSSSLKLPAKFFTRATLHTRHCPELPFGADQWLRRSPCDGVSCTGLEQGPRRWIEQLDHELMDRFPSFSREPTRAAVHRLIARELQGGTLALPTLIQVRIPAVRDIDQLLLWTDSTGPAALVRSALGPIIHFDSAALALLNTGQLLNAADELADKFIYRKRPARPCPLSRIAPAARRSAATRHLTPALSTLLDLHEPEERQQLEAVFERCVGTPFHAVIRSLIADFAGVSEAALTKAEDYNLSHVHELIGLRSAATGTVAEYRLQSWQCFPLLRSISLRAGLHQMMKALPVAREVLDSVDRGDSPIAILQSAIGINATTARSFLKLPWDCAMCGGVKSPFPIPGIEVPTPPVARILEEIGPDLAPASAADRTSLRLITERYAPVSERQGIQIARTIRRLGWVKLATELPSLPSPQVETLDYENWRCALAKELEHSGYGRAESYLCDLDIVQLSRMSKAWHRAENWARHARRPSLGQSDVDWPALLQRPVDWEELEIHELNSLNQLDEEARIMSHCVNTRGSACLSGRSHILSIRSKGRRVATAEIIECPKKLRLQELSGPHNGPVSDLIQGSLGKLIQHLNTPDNRLVNPQLPPSRDTRRKLESAYLRRLHGIDLVLRLLNERPDEALRRYRPALCHGRRKSPIYVALTDYTSRLPKLDHAIA